MLLTNWVIKRVRKWSDRLIFAALLTVANFILGIIGYQMSFAAEHIPFFISLPIATFPVGYFMWQWAYKSKNQYSFKSLLGLTFLATILIHYLNFVVLGIGRTLCFHLTGLCTAYDGTTESLIGALTWVSILRSMISLYKFGVIFWAVFTLVGLYTQYLVRKISTV